MLLRTENGQALCTIADPVAPVALRAWRSFGMLALPKGGWCCHYLLSVARLDDLDGSLTRPAEKGGDPSQKGVGMAPAGASEGI